MCVLKLMARVLGNGGVTGYLNHMLNCKLLNDAYDVLVYDNSHVWSKSRSFKLHHTWFKDCYLKYTQFRTLHRRFFTNDKLCKMGIKKSNICTFCKIAVDSVEHMILSCPVIVELWNEVNNWINEIGFINYKLSENRIILGDIENGITLTTIILLTKKVIYNSFKKKQYHQ